MPPRSKIGGILFLSCLSFCHFVLLSETLTLLITFEQWVLELWIFHMNIPCDKTIIFDYVTLTLELDQFFENFNLANKFWTVSARALIFHMSIPCDKTFLWFHYFLIDIRAFIWHMSISCDKIFLLVSRYLSLWPWPSWNWPLSGAFVFQTHLVSLYWRIDVTNVYFNISKQKSHLQYCIVAIYNNSHRKYKAITCV